MGPQGPHGHTAPRASQDGSLQCPTCKAIYGEKTGTQPPGKMEFHLIPHSLPGFADTQTIRIVYDIPTGIQVNPALAARPPLPQPRLCNLKPSCCPYRALSIPTQARSSPPEASLATATYPTTRRAGRWVPTCSPR